MPKRVAIELVERAGIDVNKLLDMLVRNAAPAGAAGRAFGIVSTGFNFGGIISPLLFGWIMDRNLPHWVFGASVIFMILTVLLALVTDRSPQASPHASDASLLQT